MVSDHLYSQSVYKSVWGMVLKNQRVPCAPRFAKGHPDNPNYVYKHSSCWQTDALK